MTVVPHYRLTMRGDLTDGEIWTCSLSLVPDNSAWETIASYAGFAEYLREHILAVNLTDDLAADCKSYFTRAGTHISQYATLTRVTLAAIDENGRYAAAASEVAVTGAGGADSTPFPHQIARKVTLESDDDLGRVKGGWYLPSPSTAGWDPLTNLWSATVTAEVRDSTQTFIQDLENAPGLDDNSFRVVIASSGRHNRDGSVRMGPRNSDVKRVNVGRRVDVIRRRSNKLSEARISDATV